MPTVLATEEVNFKNILFYPNIKIEQGHTTFITGSSGSGKSTLLKLFNATLSPTWGVIYYNNFNIADMDTIILRREVLLAGQAVYLFPTTIKENFIKYYEYRGLAAPEEKIMEKYLNLCLAPFSLSSQTQSLSGGERQRVYIAICLSLQPKVFLLDEPTSALDGENAAQLLQNLTGFCQEQHMTLVVVSHDRKLTEHFAEDRIVLERRA